MVKEFEVHKELVITLGVGVLTIGIHIKELPKTRLQPFFLGNSKELVHKVNLVLDGFTFCLGNLNDICIDVNLLLRNNPSITLDRAILLIGHLIRVELFIGLEVLVVVPMVNLLRTENITLEAGMERNDVVNKRGLHCQANLLIAHTDKDVTNILGIGGIEEVLIADIDTLNRVKVKHHSAILVLDTSTIGNQASVDLNIGILHRIRKGRNFGIGLNHHALGGTILDNLHKVDKMGSLKVTEGEHSQTTNTVDKVHFLLTPVLDISLVLG